MFRRNYKKNQVGEPWVVRGSSEWTGFQVSIISVLNIFIVEAWTTLSGKEFQYSGWEGVQFCLFSLVCSWYEFEAVSSCLSVI